MLHEEGWHPKGALACLAPGHAMCEPWSRFPLLLLLFDRRTSSESSHLLPGRWGGDPDPSCAFCAPSRLRKPSSSRVSQQGPNGTSWKVLCTEGLSAAPTLKTGLGAETLAGKQLHFSLTELPNISFRRVHLEIGSSASVDVCQQESQCSLHQYLRHFRCQWS